jgi:hypothetical protein
MSSNELSEEISVYPTTQMVMGQKTRDEVLEKAAEELYDEWVIDRRFRPEDIVKLMRLATEMRKRARIVKPAPLKYQILKKGKSKRGGVLFYVKAFDEKNPYSVDSVFNGSYVEYEGQKWHVRSTDYWQRELVPMEDQIFILSVKPLDDPANPSDD